MKFGEIAFATALNAYALSQWVANYTFNKLTPNERFEAQYSKELQEGLRDYAKVFPADGQSPNEQNTHLQVDKFGHPIVCEAAANEQLPLSKRIGAFIRRNPSVIFLGAASLHTLLYYLARRAFITETASDAFHESLLAGAPVLLFGAKVNYDDYKKYQQHLSAREQNSASKYLKPF